MCQGSSRGPFTLVREVFNFERAAHSEHAGSVCGRPARSARKPLRAHIAALHHTSTAVGPTYRGRPPRGQLEKVARTARTRARRASPTTPRSQRARGAAGKKAVVELPFMHVQVLISLRLPLLADYARETLAAALWMRRGGSNAWAAAVSTVWPQAAGGAAPPTFARVTCTSARRRGVDRRFGASTRRSRSARACGST